ncbi:ABC transporter permease [Tissierella praeacuta]|uniref:Oligopeptide transport system permease protein n=1 Tax=Tissierella praeacuta DSM 18095 TaxID=1123404 RepID=A0A1M4TQQ4_9FIRM|nr:ABC transporter permease [Tissierella praeacuta]SHE46714.1 oligopeptide transport system permease protein [Tissierella praeacuta DSM 18095]SUP04406.1 Oligopeptide transport system permease protein oppC [Tissierella praeacuta]HAE92176.1 ABC transporter permease [Tissierella sp.]
MGKGTVNKLTNSINEELFTFAEYDEEEAKRGGYSNYSYWRSTWKVFIQNKLAVFLLTLMCALLVFTIIQPYLPNQKIPTEIHINPDTKLPLSNNPPDSEFWFGTNSIGQDLWSRIWSGSRTSLLIGITVGIWEAIIGITIGAMWGYIRWLDRPITEIYNILSNIPQTIILVLMTYIMKPGLSTMIIAMGLTSWIEMARFVRNLTVIIRDREYNLASKCLGTPTRRIITKNLLPYLVSVIMLSVALSIPQTIGYEVFLTYIGLGLPVSIPSLGNLINEGRLLMMVPSQRYQLIFPSIIISLITISFYMMGNVFSDAADPKNHV